MVLVHAFGGSNPSTPAKYKHYRTLFGVLFFCYDSDMDKYKTIDEFLAGLDEMRRSQVQTLHRYILEEEPLLSEHIKWNALSYVKDSEDRITFNTVNKEQVVKLVFHMGTTKKENKKGQPILNGTKLIEWVSDIRGYMTFNSLEEITSNEKEIKQTVRDWLALG